MFHVVEGWFKTSFCLNITGMLLYGNSRVLFSIPDPLTVLVVLWGSVAVHCIYAIPSMLVENACFRTSNGTEIFSFSKIKIKKIP